MKHSRAQCKYKAALVDVRAYGGKDATGYHYALSGARVPLTCVDSDFAVSIIAINHEFISNRSIHIY